MYDLGVRAFAIFFDDISGDGTDPGRQTELLNRLDADFVRAKGDVAPLVVCPTDYSRLWACLLYTSNNWADGLKQLLKKLEKDNVPSNFGRITLRLSVISSLPSASSKYLWHTLHLSLIHIFFTLTEPSVQLPFNT